jgi:tetratricopeptide (TPR) repeat protein
MRPTTIIRLATALIASSAASVAAQGEHQHGGRPPERLGRVVFPTSCRPAAQRQFERGVALLHSFWYEESESAFREAAAADPPCAMAHWGWAMSLLHPLWAPPSWPEGRQGLTEAERAVRLSTGGTRERSYAEAIATFYRGYEGSNFRARLEAYEGAMAALAARDQKDDQARIFHALSLIAVGQLDVADTTYARQRRAAAILEPLFRENPDDPGVAHYLIHAYDYTPLAREGVLAANRYAAIAPSVPHAQHMPSHIYTLMGMWDSSIAANRRSADAARAFEVRRHLNALWDEHGHALDYLAYGYLQEGRDREAKAVVEEATAVTEGFPVNSVKNDYALAAIPARYLLERGRWAEAKALAVRPAPAWRAAEALTHFARGLGAARSGDSTSARAEVDTLRELEDALAHATQGSDWATEVRIERLAAAAWLAHLTGDTAESIKLASTAADLEDATPKRPVTPGALLPARELYGDLLLELGRPAEARRAYEASLARQPNRARSLSGAARAAEIAGDHVAARHRYQELERLLAAGDGDRPELAEAKNALTAR